MRVLLFTAVATLGLLLADQNLVMAQGKIAASLADKKWDGKSVPKDAVCKRFGGKAPSPQIKVSGIPVGTTVLIAEFNDESYSDMNNGGHGVVGIEVPKGATSMMIPAIPGETDKLPTGVSSYEMHRGTNWSGTGGTYLPPCSGGEGNMYSVKVYGAIPAKKKYTNFVRVQLGRY